MSDPVLEFFDAMRDAAVELLRFRRTREGGIRIVAAAPAGAAEFPRDPQTAKRRNKR